MSQVSSYYSGDECTPPEVRAAIIAMNEREETLIKVQLDTEIRLNKIDEEDAIEQCTSFMGLWEPGKRVFPVLPGYINELRARIEASTAE